MKEGKHAKKKFKIIEGYSVLIFIAIFFMSIGYAKITDVLITVTGTAETTSQEGVFITDVVFVDNSNADIVGSKINYFLGTVLDSKIVLGNIVSSEITYEVSLYNNSNKYIYLNTVLNNQQKYYLYILFHLKYTYLF